MIRRFPAKKVVPGFFYTVSPRCGGTNLALSSLYVPRFQTRWASSVTTAHGPQQTRVQEEPKRLPRVTFPTFADDHFHGLWPLPPGPTMPLADPARLAPYCSPRLSTTTTSASSKGSTNTSITATTAANVNDEIMFVAWADLSPPQLLQAVKVIAAGFAQSEPMARHVIPQKMPEDLRAVTYTDALGTHSWTDLCAADETKTTTLTSTTTTTVTGGGGAAAAAQSAIQTEGDVDGNQAKKEALRAEGVNMTDAIAWFIRLGILTDPTSEGRPIRPATLAQSTAAVDVTTGDVVAAVLATPAEDPSGTSASPGKDTANASTSDKLNTAIAAVNVDECVFHREMGVANGRILEMLSSMEETAIPALKEAYADFSAAFTSQPSTVGAARGRVEPEPNVSALADHTSSTPQDKTVNKSTASDPMGTGAADSVNKDDVKINGVSSFFMIAKTPFRRDLSPFLPVDIARAHFERQSRSGVKFFVSEATNPWTGALFDAMGATPALFQPHRAVDDLPKSNAPLEGVVSSPNGLISNKDSGVVLYAGRLP